MSGCPQHLHSLNAEGRCPVCTGRAALPPWITPPADALGRPPRRGKLELEASVIEHAFVPTDAIPTRHVGRCRWSDTELNARARQIGRLWAELVGVSVNAKDARRVARLSLPLPELLAVLARAARPGIGAAWPALRAAEAAYVENAA